MRTFGPHPGADLRPAGAVPAQFRGARGHGRELFFLVAAAQEMLSVATNGLRFQPTGVELVCTVDVRHEVPARYLVGIIATELVQHRITPEFDKVFLADAPLVPDSRIQGAIIATHPYLDDEFEYLTDADGRVHLQILTLIPLTAAEAQLTAESGPDELYALWEEQETDLFDFFRPCAVEGAGPTEFRIARLYDGVDSDGHPYFADERAFVQDQGVRERLAQFLTGGRILRRATGFDVDHLDPSRGAVVPLVTRTDGTWIWESALAYYLLTYGLGPEPELLYHIVSRGYEASDPPEPVWRAAPDELREGEG